MAERDIMNIENKFLKKEEIVEKNRILAEKKARMKKAGEDFEEESKVKRTTKKESKKDKK